MKRPALRRSDPKVERLSQVQLFSACNKGDLSRIAALAEEVAIPAGRVLMRQGDLGQEAFVISDGRAKATIRGKGTAKLGPGECFGEMAYLSLSSHTRGATVTASKDSRIMRIRVADLERASPGCRGKFDRAFIGILVERLNLANTRLTAG